MTRPVREVTALLPGSVQAFDCRVDAFVRAGERHTDETIARVSIEHPGPDDDPQVSETADCVPRRLPCGGPQVQASFGLVDLQAEVLQCRQEAFTAPAVEILLGE